MNEWSPGGNFSRPGTPSQAAGRSFRSQWEDPEKSARPLVVNIRAVSDSKNKSFQQHSLEDMSKSSISICSKTKKINNNGVSDPRFKRVISTGLQNDNFGNETKLGKAAGNQPEDDTMRYKHSDCNTVAENKSSQPWGNMTEIKEAAKPPSALLIDETLDSENLTQMEPASFGQAQDHLKAVEKLTFSYDIAMKSASKESLSDCTINTRNTSLASEDLMDETNNDLSVFPSATRVRKVQHWIQDQKPKIEKKQSVITVIGQMQGQDSLNSALREIDKRRKLVKELDKYAICSKITDTDKEKEISHLITKISYLSSAKKLSPDRMSIAYSEALPKESFMCDGSGDKIDNHLANNDTILNSFKIKQMDSSQSIWNDKKRSATKKNIKKGHLSNEYLVKGKIQEILNFSYSHWIFYTIILISGIFGWIMFYVFHSSYDNFDFFTKKPKTMSWYEKICMWLWEFFRPSGNYKRNTPWNGY